MFHISLILLFICSENNNHMGYFSIHLMIDIHIWVCARNDISSMWTDECKKFIRVVVSTTPEQISRVDQAIKLDRFGFVPRATI